MELKLTVEERKSLRIYQRNVDSRSEYVKVTTLLLIDKGLSPSEISEILGIDPSTVYRYLSSYQSDGLEKYLQTDYQGYWGRLSCVEISALRHALNTELFTDSKQVMVWIKEHFEVDYTPQGVVDLLNRIGFTYKKTKQVPCEANIEKQLVFLEQFKELLEKTKNSDEETVIYFADGVHPTHNTRSTYAWIEKGTERELATVSGRDRVNINAVLNAQDPTDVITLECKTINGQTTQELYEKILQEKPTAKNIFIISDNARYYRNKELTKWVEKTPINPMFLPAYSPNLNLIERLWKFMRKKVIDTHFYRTKEEFRRALLNFFNNIEQYKSELATLLTLNFHVRHSQSISF